MGMDRGHIEVIPQRRAIFITEQDCVLSKGWTTSYQFTISLLDTYYVPLPLHSDQDSFWLLDHMRVKSVQSRQREVYDDALPCKNLGFGSTQCWLKLACIKQTKIAGGQRHCLSLWQPAESVRPGAHDGSPARAAPSSNSWAFLRRGLNRACLLSEGVDCYTAFVLFSVLQSTQTSWTSNSTSRRWGHL